MNPESHHLRTIAEDPCDLESRLIYADWLEERGDPRAAILRLEQQLDQLPDDSPLRAPLLQRLNDGVKTADRHWLAIVCRRYDVVLESIGKGKLDLIVYLRRLRRLSLLESKQLVESDPPAILLQGDRWEAERFVNGFRMKPWDLFFGPSTLPIFRVQPATAVVTDERAESSSDNSSPRSGERSHDSY